ncbi:MAG: hypothetical protein N2513_07650 [Deltaproteobacteria bacterium]|nr:hypothetical protein [Deltaproteobacteria bacterium]
MGRKIIILLMGGFGFFVLFFQIQIITVIAEGGRLICAILVKNGDVIEMAHLNSIYEEEVKEILMVNGGSLELVNVITDSIGIKEYYLMDHSFNKRKWKTISFLNSAERKFSLKVKEEQIDLTDYNDRSILIELHKVNSIWFLFYFFSKVK